MALVSVTWSCNNGTERDSHWYLKQTKNQGLKTWLTEPLWVSGNRGISISSLVRSFWNQYWLESDLGSLSFIHSFTWSLNSRFSLTKMMHTDPHWTIVPIVVITPIVVQIIIKTCSARQMEDKWAAGDSIHTFGQWTIGVCFWEILKHKIIYQSVCGSFGRLLESPWRTALFCQSDYPKVCWRRRPNANRCLSLRQGNGSTWFSCFAAMCQFVSVVFNVQFPQHDEQMQVTWAHLLRLLLTLW